MTTVNFLFVYSLPALLHAILMDGLNYLFELPHVVPAFTAILRINCRLALNIILLSNLSILLHVIGKSELIIIITETLANLASMPVCFALLQFLFDLLLLFKEFRVDL